MLNLQSFRSALNASQQAAERRQFFVALPNSPVATLSDEVSALVANTSYGQAPSGLFNVQDIARRMAADPENVTPLSDMGEITMLVDVLEGPQAKTEEELFKNKTTHSLHMDGFVESLSKFVSAHLDFARNKVLPVVKYINQELQSFSTTALQSKNAASSVSLLKYSLPAILKDDSFLSQIEYMQDKNAVLADAPLTYKKKTKAEILELLKTNQSFYDEAILPWAQNLSEFHIADPEFIENVWCNFFTTEISSVNYTGNVVEASLAQRTDAALLVYLLSQRLISQNIVDAENLTVARIKELLDQTKQWAAATLINSVRRFALYERSQLLVLDINGAKKSMTVYEPVLNSFLEKGGSLETILGLLVSGRQVFQSDAIFDQKADFEKTWENYVSYYTAKSATDYLSSLREFLLFLVTKESANPNNADIQEYIKENNGYAENVQKRLSAYVSSLDQKTASDLEEIALQCGAAILFYFTDAYSILKNIEEVSASNPQTDVREAALIAAINYIADYLSDQITVS